MNKIETPTLDRMFEIQEQQNYVDHILKKITRVYVISVHRNISISNVIEFLCNGYKFNGYKCLIWEIYNMLIYIKKFRENLHEDFTPKL